MPYKEEPSLQDLIASGIESKKRATVRRVRTNLEREAEHTKSFEIQDSFEKKEEIGEQFINRQSFRNGKNAVASGSGKVQKKQNATYNAEESLDPEFLKSLRENFGVGDEKKKKNVKKQEFSFKIVDEYENNQSSEPVKSSAKIKKISYNERQKGSFEMKKYSDDSEDFDYGDDRDFNGKDETDEEPKKHKKHKKKKHHFFRNLLIFLLIAVIALVVLGYMAVSKYADLFTYVPDGDRLDIANTVSDDSVFNLLLVGTDSRSDGKNGLSDTVILLSINEKSNRIVLSSFMRDSYVQIPGYNDETWHKLNWAHSKGGPELLMDTLEFNYGVEIDDYARVDFLSFARIIDAVGGLDITVTSAEAYAMIAPMAEQNKLLGNEKGTDYLYEAGTYHMNGNQALAYSRIRKGVGDDFKRTDRQRAVLQAVADKVRTMDLKEIDSFLETVIPQISTNMDKKTVKKLMISVPFYAKYNTVSQRVPYGDHKESWDYGSTSDGSVIMVDFDLNKKQLIESIYG